MSRHEGRLQSVFTHPNCFAMYLTVTSSFIFYGLLRKNISREVNVFMWFIAFFCAVSLIFSASRASWLVYPITLLVGGLWVCWQNNRGMNWKVIQQLSVKVGVLIFISILICVLVSFSVENTKNVPSSKERNLRKNRSSVQIQLRIVFLIFCNRQFV